MQSDNQTRYYNTGIYGNNRASKQAPLNDIPGGGESTQSWVGEGVGSLVGEGVGLGVRVGLAVNVLYVYVIDEQKIIDMRYDEA